MEASYLDCIRRPLWLIDGVYSFDFFCSFQPPTQSQSRYSEPDNRDWRGRYAHAQFSPSGEERSWDSNRENRDFGGRYDSRQQEGNQSNRQDQLNSQFSRAQLSSNQVIYFSFYLFIVIFLIFFLSIQLFFLMCSSDTLLL